MKRRQALIKVQWAIIPCMGTIRLTCEVWAAVHVSWSTLSGGAVCEISLSFMYLHSEVVLRSNGACVLLPDVPNLPPAQLEYAPKLLGWWLESCNSNARLTTVPPMSVTNTFILHPRCISSNTMVNIWMHSKTYIMHSFLNAYFLVYFTNDIVPFYYSLPNIVFDLLACGTVARIESFLLGFWMYQLLIRARDSELVFFFWSRNYWIRVGRRVISSKY